MALILSNEEIAEILTMEDCLQALEAAYREQAVGKAINRPRTDVYGSSGAQERYYVFKSMEGMVPAQGVVALRINSDVIQWVDEGGKVRKEKIPLAAGKRWVGLVFLFSTETGELLAIFPDGFVQKMRVGATNGLGVKYMAREDATQVALYGSGWQAGAQLEALCAVRPVKQAKVYSPTRQNREAFAKEMSHRLGINVSPADSAAEAARGADILGAATNSISPVMEAGWLSAGMHVTCVKPSELGDAVLARCDRIAIHTRKGAPFNYIMGLGDEPVMAHDPLEVLRGEQPKPPKPNNAIDSAPVLDDLIMGMQVGRGSPQEITCFINNVGLGIQFAALGAKVLENARQAGAGRELPGEWFSESVHP